MEIKYKLEIYKDHKLVVTENLESSFQLETAVERAHKSYEVLKEVMEVTYKLNVKDIDGESKEDYTTAKFYSEPEPYTDYPPVAEEVYEEQDEIEEEAEIIPEDSEETARIYSEDTEDLTEEEYLDERDTRNFDF